MKFVDYIKKNQTPEWIHYYINYPIPAKLLRCLKRLRGRVNFRFGEYHINNLKEDERQFVEEVRTLFHTAMSDQVLKFEDFLRYKTDFCLKPTLLKIIFNVKNYKGRHFESLEGARILGQMKVEVEKFYKEINFVKQYMNLNFRIFYKLTNKYKKAFSDINMYEKESINVFNEMMRRNRIHKVYKKLEDFLRIIETIYIECFYKEKEIKEGYDKLNKLISNDQFSLKESFYFGLFMGAFFICVLLCALLLGETRFFTNNPTDFVVYQFPIFRGSLLLFLYMLFLGVDVYVWERYNINYKRVFDIELRTSSAYQIMKRAFGFLALWILLFSYCALSSAEYFEKGIVFDKSMGQFLPPFVWVFFFIYMFFPFKHCFNYKGRIFFFKVLRDITMTPFVRSTFRTTWSTDQILSFTILFKDLLYSSCYWMNYKGGKDALRAQCLSPSYKFNEFMMIMSILYWKFLVSTSKLAYLIKDKSKMTDAAYKTAINRSAIGLTRSLVSITTSIVSYYLTKGNDWLKCVYIALAILTTLSSVYCDMVFDWGFLASKNLLRDKLAYSNKAFYYVALFLNFFLRLSWTITISPFALKSPITKSCFTLLTSLLECFRRMLWNFFKVEFEHLKSEGNFNAIKAYDLPFEVEIDMSTEEVRKIVDQQVGFYLKKAYVDRAYEVNCLEQSGGEEIMKTFDQMAPRKTSLSAMAENIRFMSEVDEKKGLSEYNKSLEQCKIFISRAKHSDIGKGSADLRPENLVRSSNVTRNFMVMDSGIVRPTSRTQANKAMAFEPHIAVRDEENIRKNLFTETYE